MRRKLSFASLDPILIIGLLVALILSVHGIQWGRVEDWHPDEMVFSRVPFADVTIRPVGYQKPPFHAYFALLVRLPAKLFAWLLKLTPPQADAIDLLAARLLTVAMYLGVIILMYLIARMFFGKFFAKILVILLSTSAGFIAFSHFLTVDIPVTFWMLLAMYFSLRIFRDGKQVDYLLAGFITGIATATKYNGLGIAVTILAGHLLRQDLSQARSVNFWRQTLFNKRFLAAILLVPAGFIIGNPYIVVDFPRFASDFIYSTTVTPVYTGSTTGSNYLSFFTHIGQLIGIPALVLFLLGFVYTIIQLVFSKNQGEKKPLLILFSAFLVYYLIFGSFPRLVTRFVLPIVPAWLLLSGLFWEKLKSQKLLVYGLLLIFVPHNLYCSYLVGTRFLNDPRMQAQSWVQSHLPESAAIESSPYVPDWNKLPGVHIENNEMPYITGRQRVFEDILSENEFITTNLEQYEPESIEDLRWYSQDELQKRNPDFIAVDSLYYSRFLGNPYYPEMNTFITNLLAEKADYHIVFRQDTQPVPAWIYPHKIDALENRLVILQRSQ